jgi:hypothetical protein
MSADMWAGAALTAAVVLSWMAVYSLQYTVYRQNGKGYAIFAVIAWVIALSMLAGCAPKEKRKPQPPPVFIGGGGLAEEA